MAEDIKINEILQNSQINMNSLKSKPENSLYQLNTNTPISNIEAKPIKKKPVIPKLDFGKEFQSQSISPIDLVVKTLSPIEHGDKRLDAFPAQDQRQKRV